MKTSKKKKASKRKTFKEAVESTPNVSTGYKPGLRAFEKDHSKKIIAVNANLKGSLFIDECLTAIDQGNRWDYAFGYGEEVYFVEVHSANTSEVSTVLRKLTWLKDWLNHSAPEINKLKAKECYHWLQSGKFDILKNSPQYRLAIQSGILPKATLNLK